MTDSDFIAIWKARNEPAHGPGWAEMGFRILRLHGEMAERAHKLIAGGGLPIACSESQVRFYPSEAGKNAKLTVMVRPFTLSSLPASFIRELGLSDASA